MGIIDYIEAKNQERIRRAYYEDAKKITFGAIIGLAIGAATGILYAPKSGEETRQDLADKVQNASEEVMDRANEVAINAKNAYKTKVESKLTSIRPAIEAGMDAAQEAFACEKEANVDRVYDHFTDEDWEAAEHFEEKKEKVKDAAQEVKEDLKETGEDIKEGVKNIKNDVKNDAKEMGKDIKDDAKDLGDDVKKTKDKAFK